MREAEILMGTSEVARRLAISPDRVRQLARSGHLPPDRRTALGQRLWLPETIERFAHRRSSGVERSCTEPGAPEDSGTR
jgi:DNA-binding transcriptional MerR regulator